LKSYIAMEVDKKNLKGTTTKKKKEESFHRRVWEAGGLRKNQLQKLVPRIGIDYLFPTFGGAKISYCSLT